MEDFIYVKYPEGKYNAIQALRLAGIDNPKELAKEAFLLNHGNAVMRYHKLSESLGITPELHSMWLEGLSEPMKGNFAKLGFEENKRTLAFTRFVNEMSDIGLEEFILNLLNEEDGKLYKELSKEDS